jgi:predicted AlkP superfamily phosphohydrolase/phosphomutase
MGRHIFYGPPRTWLRTTLVLGLVLACLWGSLQGGYTLVQNGYVSPPTLTVIFYTVKSQLNAALSSALLLALLSSCAFTVCYLLLILCRFSSRRADVGAVAWMITLLLCLAAGYQVNKTAWFPPFWSLGGMIGNALVFTLFLFLGMVAWKGLQRVRDRLEEVVERSEQLVSRRLIVGIALYWVIVNVAFYAINASTSAQATTTQGTRAQKVALFALDGATWKVMNPLLDQGRLPNIRRLMESGTYGFLTTIAPTLSPIIWTTVATGKPMSAHGIDGFVVQGTKADQEKLMTSNMRRVKALWNILSEHNRSVGVVGWFVTWPAEPVNGFVVSPYAGIGRTHKGRIHKDIPQQTYPEDLFHEVEPLLEEEEGHLEAQFRRIFPRLAMDSLSETQQNVVEDTREVLLADMLNARVGLHLLQQRTPEFFALYLGGTDVVGHRFWKYMDPHALPYKVTAEHVAMFSDAVTNYYLFADEVVGRLLAVCDENTLIIVISDHGMEPFIPHHGNDDWYSGAHDDAPPGIIIMSGKGARRGPLPVPASVLDIAPTILYALDLPLAEDMIGLPVLGAFDRALIRDHSPVYIRSYENGKQWTNGGSARESSVDDVLKERLRSLGYL